MNKRCIIYDVWYEIDGKSFEIYDWPEDLKEIFKEIYNAI